MTRADIADSVDAYHFGNLSRFANHSCVPNAMVCNIYSEFVVSTGAD